MIIFGLVLEFVLYIYLFMCVNVLLICTSFYDAVLLNIVPNYVITKSSDWPLRIFPVTVSPTRTV